MSATSSMITIKTNYDGDVRRFTFDEAKVTSSLFATIQSTIATAYGLGSQAFCVTYTDDENDECAISGDEETREALRFASLNGRVLKLTVVVSRTVTAAAKVVAPTSVPVAVLPVAAAAAADETKVATPVLRASAAFVSDLTLIDGSRHLGGTTVAKTWLVKNNGAIMWRRGTRVVAAGDDAATVATLDEVAIGDEVKVTVMMTLPEVEGVFRKEYKLVTADNEVMDGDSQLWVDIVVYRAECSAAFVRDVTVPDGTEVAANTTVEKVWTIRNDGSRAWPAGCQLIHADGAVTSSPLFPSPVPVPVIAPNETVDLVVRMVVPSASGRHHGEWHLVQADGTKFAHDYALWSQVVVPVPALTTAEVIEQLPKWLAVPEVREAIVKHMAPAPAPTPSPTAEVVHDGITCDGCGVFPIRGLRFKCTSCADFDFCQACEAKSAANGMHPSSHVFIKAKLPLPRAVTPAPAAVVRPPVVRLESKASDKTATAWRVAAKKPSGPPRAHFKADVTLPDGCHVTAGSTVIKRWSITNIGDQWPVGVHLVFVGGTLSPATTIVGPSLSPVPLACPDQTVDVWACVQVPAAVGRHTGYYRLATADGKRFGHRLWVDVIAVTAASSAVATTARPTATPAVPALPSSSPAKKTETKKVAAPSPVKKACPYVAQLKQLKDLGYKDEEMLAELLMAANGRVQQVVEWLVTPVV